MNPALVVCLWSSQLMTTVALTVISARVDGELDLAHVLISPRGGLGPTNRTFDVGVANIELVVVICESLQVPSFNLR